ncbi:MAG: hypothetical protein D8B60_00495 [Moraxella sp.]|nr:MAG: hypothetical protein D8B60_00495 [Moraxella sp.]
MRKLSPAQAVSLVVGMVLSGAAFAAPEVEQVTTAIKGITTSTDAVGNSFITVIVGIVIFGFIIGMIWRKGK